MESTAQNRTHLLLGIVLSPIFLPFLGGFALYSWRHRRGYRGPEEFTPRHIFFKKVYGIASQYSRQENHLKMGDYFTQKNTLMILYSPKIRGAFLTLSFLLTEAYKKHFQRPRLFKFCIISKTKPRGLFLLSSLEILNRLPSTKYLKESLYPLICFTDSIEKLRKLVLESYRTVTIFRVEDQYSGLKGIRREFQVVGSLNVRERLGNSAQTELKLERILEILI